MKKAISVARSIMEHTTETLLVGDDGKHLATVSRCNDSCWALGVGTTEGVLDIGIGNL